MSFFKQSLLREVLGKPAMESSEIVTEEIGSTAGGQVEIERLKQENLDLMEIHALEQDVALIEQQGEGAEELGYALDEVGELKASMESYLEKGGMTAADAAGINRSLRFLNRRLGGALDISTPATESFQGATADRITLTVAMEGAIGEFFSKIWEGIKNIYNKIVDTVKGWFGKSSKKSEEVETKLEEAKKEVAEAEKKSDKKEVPAEKVVSGTDPKSVLGVSGLRKLSNGYDFDDYLDAIKEQISNSEEYISGINEYTKSARSTIESYLGIVTNDSGSSKTYTDEEMIKMKLSANHWVCSQLAGDTSVKLSTAAPDGAVSKLSDKLFVHGKSVKYEKSATKDGSASFSVKVINVRPGDENANVDAIKMKEGSTGNYNRIGQICGYMVDSLKENRKNIEGSVNHAKEVQSKIAKISLSNITDESKKKYYKFILDSINIVLNKLINTPALDISNAAIDLGLKIEKMAMNTAKITMR